jgi:hypothetical protein
MHFEPVEARCDLLDRVQLFEGILDPILVAILHPLESGGNVVVTGFLGSSETLLEVLAPWVDLFVEDDDLTEYSEVAE